MVSATKGQSFPQQLLKSRWTEKARAIEMTTDKVSEPQLWCWCTEREKKMMSTISFEPWHVGTTSRFPDRSSQTKLLPFRLRYSLGHRTGGCIVTCWSDVESNSPRSSSSSSPHAPSPVLYGSASANELGRLRKSYSKRWLHGKA